MGDNKEENEMNREKKNWRNYAEVSYNALKSNVEAWKNGNRDFIRCISRIYYINVFDCGNFNNTGLVSSEALEWPEEATYDHCFRPQLIGRMIMDNPEKYLSDYETFEKLFFLSCMVVKVTKDENRLLSLQTDNRSNEYKILTPTNLLYETVGIELYKKVEGKYHHVGFDIPLNCSEEDLEKYQELFDDLLEYEKKFM